MAEKEKEKKKDKPKHPIWIWEGATKAGEKKTGRMEAIDKTSVEAKLKKTGITPTKVRKKTLLDADLSALGGGSISRKDLIVFTRQFSTMIDAGLPLVQCLDLLGSGAANPAMGKIILAVKEKVESGTTLCDALSEHPKVFDVLYCQLVKAGETAGILDTILQRIAAQIEKADRLTKQIKSALTYPIIILGALVVVTIVLLLFVIPTFEDMFEDMGGTLPGLTQFIIDFSNFAQANALYGFGGAAAFITAFKLFTRNPKGKILWDKFKIALPMFGDLIKKMAVARFTRTTGTMLQSGVPILDGLEICSKAAGNYVVEMEIKKIQDGVSEGQTIVQPLQGSKVFPPLVVQMIGVGEMTGALDQMLEKIADFFDEESDEAVKTLVGMMEPVLMLLLAVVVGGFLIGMYLPIFTMAGGA